jgi:hypothetical protein
MITELLSCPMVQALSSASGKDHESASFQQLGCQAALAQFPAAPAKAQLDRDLLPMLDSHALLVTDANAAYRAFARKHGIAHEAVNLRAGVRVRRANNSAIHVQNVNAYHGGFNGWLRRFHGVASRYLPNYLGWQWALDGGRIGSAEQLFGIAAKVIHR